MTLGATAISIEAAYSVAKSAGWRAGAVELVARAGVTRTETLQSLDLPFYATLGANDRF